MRRAAEIGIAVLLALALHLAAFAGMGAQAPAGVQAAGQGGADLVSLSAADAATARLLAAWDSPPPVVMPAALAALPPQEVPPPQAPSALPPVDAAPRIAPSQIALPSPARADSTPRAAEAPPPPPTPPEPAPPEPAPKQPAPPEPAPPQPRDAPSAEAAPAQQAAGSGGQSAAGTEGSAQAAATGTAEAARLTTRWGAEIRARVERRKAYPRDGAGAAGTVTLRLTVGADGRLRAVGIAASSGSAALDQAALRAVERAGRFPRAPRALGEGGATFTLPVTFRP